ncbi:DUF2510 domain-containing protein [Parafrigoribacterium soli]|uniref:DUF2510 domain-containing protein n=1 Tax=Parafrigoribacterium soli TaxID=3144663 RepID=UPI0032EDADEF
MIPDDVVRLPAGWYPDPTGLPQLRWWDNHAWTQHTTAARQPLIVQESPLAWADDLPTRRERREREREDRGTDDVIPATAQSLLELDPPSESDEAADVPAPESGADTDDVADAAASAPAQEEAHPADELDADGAGFAPVSASGHAGRIPSVPSLGEDGSTPAPATATAAAVAEAPVAAAVSTPDDSATIPVVPMPVATAPASAAAAPAVTFPTGPGAPGSFVRSEPFGTQTVGTPLFDQVAASAAGVAAPETRGSRAERARRQRVQHPTVGANGLSNVPISTAPVWVIALFPLLQLVVVLLIVTGLGSSAANQVILPVMLVIVYVAMIALAIADVHLLRRHGVDRPAHWWWALLSAPVYLFVRAMVLTRKTGRGFGPMLVWFALALLSVASVLAVPGMLIAAAPAVFSAQAEQAVTADAAANGAALDVGCPDTPPILVGQSFTCTGTGNGRSFQVEVSLQRVNGWIDWRVDDWGVNTLSR